MTDTIAKKIQAIIEEAETQEKVFGFGDEIYTPAEALEAAIDHADEDIDAIQERGHYGAGDPMTREEAESVYLARLEACAFYPEED